MGPIEEILSVIADAGKIITDLGDWSLKVESPYVKGKHGPQLAATVTSVSTPGDDSLQFEFTFNGSDLTVLASPDGEDASVSFGGTEQTGARLVTAGFDPIHVDFRPITLADGSVVRLNFRFNDL